MLGSWHICWGKQQGPSGALWQVRGRKWSLMGRNRPYGPLKVLSIPSSWSLYALDTTVSCAVQTEALRPGHFHIQLTVNTFILYQRQYKHKDDVDAALD